MKTMVYVAPNGRKYRSKRAYQRSVKAMFAQLAKSSKFKRSKRTAKEIRKLAKLREEERRKKAFTPTPVVKRGAIEHDVAGYTNKKERTHTATFIDEQGSRIYVIENEEAGKYTPKRTITKMEYLEGADALGITKLNPRTQKPVSSTMVKVDAPRTWELESKFKSGGNLSMAELRVIAKERGIKSAGITKQTLEKRLRKDMGLMNTKKTKSKIKPSTAKQNIESVITNTYDKHNTRFTGGVVKIDKVYDDLKKQGYSDTEIKQGLKKLELSRKFELQTASDHKALAPKEKEKLKKLGLWQTKERGTVAYLIKRKEPTANKNTAEQKKSPEVKKVKAQKITERQLELIGKATKRKNKPKKIDPNSLSYKIEQLNPDFLKGRIWEKHGKKRIYFNRSTKSRNYTFYIDYTSGKPEVRDFFSSYWNGRGVYQRDIEKILKEYK